jgi:hypothetical protein
MSNAIAGIHKRKTNWAAFFVDMGLHTTTRRFAAQAGTPSRVHTIWVRDCTATITALVRQ